MAAKESFNAYGLLPLHPENAQITYHPVATTQTLAAGDPVILSSGQIAVAVSASSAELCGAMAQASVTATAGTLVAVYDDPETIFRARTSADASSSNIGDTFDLSGTTGTFIVNVGATSQNLFILKGVVAGDDNTVVGANLKIKIAKHAFADTST